MSHPTPDQTRAIQADTLRRCAALMYRGVNQKVNDDLTYLSRAMVRDADALAAGNWELPS